jgi:hypothetical protein
MCCQLNTRLDHRCDVITRLAISKNWNNQDYFCIIYHLAPQNICQKHHLNVLLYFRPFTIVIHVYSLLLWGCVNLYWYRFILHVYQCVHWSRSGFISLSVIMLLSQHLIQLWNCRWFTCVWRSSCWSPQSWWSLHIWMEFTIEPVLLNAGVAFCFESVFVFY